MPFSKIKLSATVSCGDRVPSASSPGVVQAWRLGNLDASERGGGWLGTGSDS